MGTEMTTAWMDLRRAALSAIRRGWLVTPAASLDRDRRWCGRPEACVQAGLLAALARSRFEAGMVDGEG